MLTYGPNANVNVRPTQPYSLSVCPPPLDISAAPIADWLPAWREFVRTVVVRYKDRIQYWEIQNEPNSQCFWRKVDLSARVPSAADYVKVLRAAHDSISSVSPGAQVVLGGLSYEPQPPGIDYFEYLKQIHDAGGWPYFDILAVHPYRPPQSPEEIVPRSRFSIDTLRSEDKPANYNLVEELAAFNRLMSAWGAKPMWITEMGWSVEALKGRAAARGLPKDKDAGPRIVQSDYLIRSCIQAVSARVQVVIWHELLDNPAGENPTERSYGIIGEDFSPKPAYYGFSTMAHLLAGSEFKQQVHGQTDRGQPGDDDEYEYRFAKGQQTIIALWKSRGGDVPRKVLIENIAASSARVIGPKFGPYSADAGKVISTTNGTVSLGLTERPVFLVFDVSPWWDQFLANLQKTLNEEQQKVRVQLGKWFAEQQRRANAELQKWWQEQNKRMRRQLEDELKKLTHQWCGASILPLPLLLGAIVAFRRRRWHDD